MNIPREGDMVRFYIQLSPDTDLVNRETGRVDMAKASAERVIESAARIMAPFPLSTVGEAEWWTVYLSTSVACCLCGAVRVRVDGSIVCVFL